MTDDTIVDIHITGRASEPPTHKALQAALGDCLALFGQKLNRLPTDEEADMIWAAVQRYYGIDERYIEPPSQRRDRVQ